MISSYLEEELKCLVLYDVEMEARDSATRSSVLSQKRYNNLANFSWDSCIAEMVDKQSFLAEILLAIALPWKFSSHIVSYSSDRYSLRHVND